MEDIDLVFYNDTDIKKLNIDIKILSFYLVMLLTFGIIWLGYMYEVLDNNNKLLKLRLLELESYIHNNLTSEISNNDPNFSKNIDNCLIYRQNKIAVLDELRKYIDNNNLDSVDQLSKILELKHNKFMVLKELRENNTSNSIDDLKEILKLKLNRINMRCDSSNKMEDDVNTENLDNMLIFKKNRIKVLDELHNRMKDSDIINLDNNGNTINGGIFSNITDYFSYSSNSNDKKKNN